LCDGGEQLPTQAEKQNGEKDLHRIWDMCLDACDGTTNNTMEQSDSKLSESDIASKRKSWELEQNAITFFKQVYFVGCVRAGITRLEKNLVGVFDLR
jgi:hypothetical protein